MRKENNFNSQIEEMLQIKHRPTGNVTNCVSFITTHTKQDRFK